MECNSLAAYFLSRALDLQVYYIFYCAQNSWYSDQSSLLGTDIKNQASKQTKRVCNVICSGVVLSLGCVYHLLKKLSKIPMSKPHLGPIKSQSLGMQLRYSCVLKSSQVIWLWSRTTALEKQTCIKCLPLSVLSTMISAFFKVAPCGVIILIYLSERLMFREVK